MLLHALHGKRAYQSMATLVRDGRRCSEKCDDRIPFVFVERALILILDDVSHRGQVIVQQIHQFFRIPDLLGKSREALNICEKCGQVLFFAAKFWLFFAVQHFIDQIIRNILLKGFVQKVLVSGFEIEPDKKRPEECENAFDNVSGTADVKTVRKKGVRNQNVEYKKDEQE